MYRKTRIPGIVADIVVKESKEGKFRAIATAINEDTETKINELGVAQSKAVSSMRLEMAINQVINELEQRYDKARIQAIPDAETMKKAFFHVRDLAANGMLLSPGWKNKDTNMRALKYFERNILPLLIPYANPSEKQFLELDRQAIEEKIIKLSGKYKRKYTRELEITASHLSDADLIYQHMRDDSPNLPDIRLSTDEFVKRTPSEEQVKSLPHDSIVEFCKKLKEAAGTTPEKVLFAVMVLFGLRPAEAGAITPEKINWAEYYCTVEVIAQVIKGKIVKRTKNKYSLRTVIIPFWGRTILQMCCDSIMNHRLNDNTPINDPVECAEWVKNHLSNCGVSMTTFSRKQRDQIDPEDLDEEDNDDSGLIEKKMACYVLRRNFASMCRNTMGLSLAETDALMGHVVQNRDQKKANTLLRIDLNSIQVQKQLAAKMERFVFDPEISLHPGCHPIEISETEKIEMSEYSNYIIKTVPGKTIELNFNCFGAEPGEEICIEMPKNAQPKLSASSLKKNWERTQRLVIGDDDEMKAIKWER